MKKNVISLIATLMATTLLVLYIFKCEAQKGETPTTTIATETTTTTLMTTTTTTLMTTTTSTMGTTTTTQYVSNSHGLTACYSNWFTHGNLQYQFPLYISLARIDSVINFNWRRGSPKKDVVNSDLFSVIWRGQIKPLYSETYTFETETDDGVRLWINNVKIIDDNWTIHPVQKISGKIALVAGQRYNIVIKYFENDRDAICKLRWSSKSQKYEIVPSSQLYIYSGASTTTTTIKPTTTTTSVTTTTFYIGDSSTHDYPKLGLFHWGGATADWYSRFDFLITANNGSDFARQIKAKNPNIKIVPTQDWNVGATLAKIQPRDWLVRDSRGNAIPIYGGNMRLFDITNFCPTLKGYGDKRYNEYLVKIMTTLADQSVFDGVASDGMWDRPRGSANIGGDVDLDRNGINDYDEPGKGAAWVEKVWVEGIMVTLEALQEQLGDDKIIHINSGHFHKFGWKFTNGITSESVQFTASWSYLYDKFNQWKGRHRQPGTAIIDAKGYIKTSYQWMRFFLGQSMLLDMYFSYSDMASGEHHYDFYYDEFDVDIGQPTSMPLHVLGNRENGIWVRFFEKGIVIVNIDNKPNTINDSEISILSGYDGRYYRFLGGQSPKHNDGTIFDTITLFGRTEQSGCLGDAIILLKESRVVVSDIIIDNTDPGTSPGSNKAQLIGNWIQTNYNCGGAYTLGASGRMGKYHIALSGNGAEKAIFRPKIGVPGNYEIFEWHAYLGDGPDKIQESKTVPHEIKLSNGKKQVIIIDQSKNHGQWNSLGEYCLNAGLGNMVTIYHNQPNQTIADAIKFVYKN